MKHLLFQFKRSLWHAKAFFYGGIPDGMNVQARYIVNAGDEPVVLTSAWKYHHFLRKLKKASDYQVHKIHPGGHVWLEHFCYDMPHTGKPITLAHAFRRQDLKEVKRLLRKKRLIKSNLKAV